MLTCNCMLVWVSSSAFFSSDITHTFLFCLQRVAAARFLSRNFRLRSSGSSSMTRLRRPPLGGGDWRVCVGCMCCAAGDNCKKKSKKKSLKLHSLTRHHIHIHRPGCRPITCHSPRSDLSSQKLPVWEFSLKQHVPCTRGPTALWWTSGCEKQQSDLQAAPPS